jgi:SEC-C motif-containing protein
MTKMQTQSCPCGKAAGKRLLTYADCCGRFVEDFENSPAPSAESLMRSRYSAFVLQREAYLLATWDPATRPPSIEFEADVKWLGLNVREASETAAETAEVEFVARMRVQGRGQRIRERSRFVKRDGRWFYVDGDMLE